MLVKDNGNASDYLFKRDAFKEDENPGLIMNE
jgi:hypothetical protein